MRVQRSTRRHLLTSRTLMKVYASLGSNAARGLNHFEDFGAPGSLNTGTDFIPLKRRKRTKRDDFGEFRTHD